MSKFQSSYYIRTCIHGSPGIPWDPQNTSGEPLLRGVVSKFPDWIFRARTECSYHTSR